MSVMGWVKILVILGALDLVIAIGIVFLIISLKRK